MADDRPVVFISYGRKDEKWKDRLATHLNVLAHGGILEEWDDRKISGGDDWYKEIQDAVARASVVILLVSADFLSSGFIIKEEIPKMLERREKDGMRVFPVILRPCAWKDIRWLSRIQARPLDGKPILSEDSNHIEQCFADIASEISKRLKPACGPKTETGAFRVPPDCISISRLPITGPNLFGREAELSALDDAWASSDTRVISLTAWGGVGKSALVNHWLAKMAKDYYRGAEKVFGWSFYSQGTSDRVVSADVFI